MPRSSSTFLLGLIGVFFAASIIGFVRASQAISAGFAYGKDKVSSTEPFILNYLINFPILAKVRGVNIGGWLVLEPWITPSLFERTGNTAIVDEYTFCQLQDTNVAKAALQQHWDSFYTEEDFQEIAAAGYAFYFCWLNQGLELIIISG